MELNPPDCLNIRITCYPVTAKPFLPNTIKLVWGFRDHFYRGAQQFCLVMVSPIVVMCMPGGIWRWQFVSLSCFPGDKIRHTLIPWNIRENTHICPRYTLVQWQFSSLGISCQNPISLYIKYLRLFGMVACTLHYIWYNGNEGSKHDQSKQDTLYRT